MVTNFVPILEQHQVALVLNGHEHYYERFRTANGVTYVVTGGGGRPIYPRLSPCTHDAISQYSAARHHFVAIEVDGTTLTLRAVSLDGTVFDQATITR